MVKKEYYSVFEFIDEVDVVVNTINTKGYMGKGLAYEFARWFPEMEEKYINECKQGKIKPGDLWAWETKEGNKKIVVANIATKDDYKLPSKIEYVEKGLENLYKFMLENNFKTAALPPLGAGLGGLNFRKVEEMVFKKFENFDGEIIFAVDKEVGPKEEEALERLKESVEKLKESSFYPQELEKIRPFLLKVNEGFKFRRFRDLKTLKGIGSKKYEKLLNYFWKKYIFSN